MDESGRFFKALLSKGYAHKGKNIKVEKFKVKNDSCFFVSADGVKVDKPIVIWKSKKNMF